MGPSLQLGTPFRAVGFDQCFLRERGWNGARDPAWVDPGQPDLAPAGGKRAGQLEVHGAASDTPVMTPNPMCRREGFDAGSSPASGGTVQTASDHRGRPFRRISAGPPTSGPPRSRWPTATTHFQSADNNHATAGELGHIGSVGLVMLPPQRAVPIPACSLQCWRLT